MEELCADLRAEYAELANFAETLTPQQWSTVTDFYGWTPFDEISHLCFFDQAGLLAATDTVAFNDDARAIAAEMADGKQISEIARSRYGHLSGRELVEVWRGQFGQLVDQLAQLDSKARLPWYGPSMSARSFATARIMETWAHGQDIYDALDARRRPSARLKHIAHLGVTTFGWTFVNRQLSVPDVLPHVALLAPDGSTWSWNAPSSDEYVRGSAEEFCLLVTQRRNLHDLRLEYHGNATRSWLAVAQCFAGPPVDGPEPGQRA